MPRKNDIFRVVPIIADSYHSEIEGLTKRYLFDVEQAGKILNPSTNYM